MSTDPVAANIHAWDGRVADHLVAYGAEAFADDPTALRAETEVQLLAPHLPGGSLEGLDVVHLQCHIGVDTISLARRGARAVGTDLSGEAVAAARALAARAGTSDVTFVRCRNEDAPDVLGREFDVVLTSVGVLAWLSDLDSWARAVARLLRPGGVFLVYDAHPMLYALEYERDDGQLVLGKPYFARETPVEISDGLTYAAPARADVTYEWPHHLAEVLTAVLQAGLRIEAFGEHRTMPWAALPGMDRTERGFALPPGSPECPLMFSLVARR
ncbi:class I SAM-dependent methyltransferase [Pseudokineococcus sp. 1T1Z-3]|uniref:class I SAM-dependent methyltransferase n=1 Tax=Pseudokineococcus sp. 1T1Z-3 TaxID=3132745 RepID=UPI0030A70173